MNSKMSLVSIAIILSVGAIISMAAYAHGDKHHTGFVSGNSTHSYMPMKGGMGMSSMHGKGTDAMMSRCKTMKMDRMPRFSTSETQTVSS